MKGSPPPRAVLRLRRHGDAAGCRSAADTRRALPGEYALAVNDVEETFVRYPIPLLQVVGTKLLPFLYHSDWPEGASVRMLRRDRRDVIRLLPSVVDRLAVLGPLLRPLIELHWTRDVARWSGVVTEDDRLAAHLFGAERVAFPSALRAGLAELQAGRYFYCGEQLPTRPDVDHFLAWSRWPNDAVENLVLADRCNGAKRDHLVAGSHLERWFRRVDDLAADLREIAVTADWSSDPERSRGLVRSTYTHIAPGTPLRVRGNEFVEAVGPLL
jgi:hypothetical protein